jgi:dTMP kinase
MAPGRFIVLEGIDGAGTTTQASAIASALRSEGRTVQVTREPSDGHVGKLIRSALAQSLALDPAALALLFAADRLDHLAVEVQPALARGEDVVCDRYLLSSLAYQGSSLPLRWVQEINGRALSPSLTLFIDVPWEVARQRRAARGGEPELFDADEQQAKIAAKYRELIATLGDAVVQVDGTQPIPEVTRRCLEAIRR